MTRKKDKTDAPSKGAARKSRDSSLYRDIIARDKARTDSAQGEDQTNPHGNPPALDRKGSAPMRFVLATTDPEVIPVDHQAVISELTSSLDQIEVRRTELQAQLAGNNRANKLEIAQIKGRLADLSRKKRDIEALLKSRDADGGATADPTAPTDDLPA